MNVTHVLAKICCLQKKSGPKRAKVEILKKFCLKFFKIILILVGDKVYILKAYISKIITEEDKVIDEILSEKARITIKKVAMKAKIFEVPINVGFHLFKIIIFKNSNI